MIVCCPPPHGLFYEKIFEIKYPMYFITGSIPPQDDIVFKSVEWIICVWQRLNEGLLKLGLQDNVLGPATFLSCPIEFSKSKPILR